MTREEKEVIINELTEKFADCANFYITDASGMTVAKTNIFRRTCYEKGIEYRVIKNSLIRKALERTGKGDFSSFDDTVFRGFSGVMFSPENPKLPATLIKDFRKKNS
jgi:large subunit ribosomal protein L10